jgi:hypothetical protein
MPISSRSFPIHARVTDSSVTMILDTLMLNFMKNNKKPLIYVLALAVILSIFFLWNRSRTETWISIVSASVNQGTADQKVAVRYRVDSGASDFTIIILPDTQHYSDQFPEIYTSQTQWIVENKDDLNIVFVSHMGDIVQNDDTDEAEWKAADAAMRLLDNVVPYGVLPGNHDMQVGGAALYYEQYFPSSRFEEHDWWGGSFDRNHYSYQLFSAGGDDYLILHMQYCPTAAGMDWANNVLAQWPERNAIISTHSYLAADGALMKNCQNKSNGYTNGAKMWNRLVKKNPNVFMVLAGHIPGFARREDFEGRIVYQVLADYQDFPLGGSGYLRIMKFEPQNDIIRVSTYSPYLDQYLEESGNQFDLAFDMTGDAVPQGNVLVYSGVKYCLGTVAQGSCELHSASEEPISVVYLGDASHKGSASTVPSDSP